MKKIFGFFLVFNLVLFSCSKDSDTATENSNLPSIVTNSTTDLSTTTASLGGTISTDGGTPVTARGVVYSTSPNPTISLVTKTIDGTGLGSFSSMLSGLTSNTIYYARAYATNSNGTAYGNEINFKTAKEFTIVNAHYVSTSGDDSRTATEAKNPATPWKTIQNGVNKLPSGATLVVSGGVYTEIVNVPESCNGSESQPTQIVNALGETPIIDGNNKMDYLSYSGIFNLFKNKYITVKGIKVINSDGPTDIGWFGIYVQESENITIEECYTFNTKASGIYVRLTPYAKIINNKVQKACQQNFRRPSNVGTQEDISIVASNDFLVTKNEVWDSVISNLAGGEGIDVKGGSIRGEVSYNYIHDIAPLGIYIDAGTKEMHTIKVFSNKVLRTSGVGLAAELGGFLRDVYFYNNIISESSLSGIVYQETGNGKFGNVYVVNNTFYNNGKTGFAGDVGSFTRNTGNYNNVIKNNIFYNKGVANYKFSIWYNYPAGHIISNNLYFDFKPSSNGANSFTEANLTFLDARDNPNFILSNELDFSINKFSVARNKAVPIYFPGTTVLMYSTDINGKNRGNAWDLGAYQY